MCDFILLLHPEKFQNPDLDIRYALPDLIVARSAGVVKDNGYDYAETSNALMLFLKASDFEKAEACIVDVLERETVVENELKRCGIVVAVEKEGKRTVVYPPDFVGEFPSS